MNQETVALLNRALQDEHRAIMADPDLKDLLARIRDHEMYHERVFSDLLKEVQKQG